jgi:hypothetical protein
MFPAANKTHKHWCFQYLIVILNNSQSAQILMDVAVLANIICRHLQTIHKSKNKSQLQDQSRPPQDIAEIPQILQVRSWNGSNADFLCSIGPPD